MSAAFTQYIDVAQVVLYLFWAFLGAVILYLHVEDKREGYPLESERSAYITVQGWPAVPAPKTYLLSDGSTIQAPRAEPYDARPVMATPIGPWPGAPLEPDGDPMVDGVGPAAWAARRDEPEMDAHGHAKIRPMGAIDGCAVSAGRNPIGMNVIANDRTKPGTVTEVWVDASEQLVRYLEVTLDGGEGKRLLPITMARIKADGVHVGSISGARFVDVPKTAKSDVVTKLEEDKISAFYAGGWMYDQDRKGSKLAALGELF